MRMYYIGNHRVNKTLGTRKTRARALAHTHVNTVVRRSVRTALRCATVTPSWMYMRLLVCVAQSETLW